MSWWDLQPSPATESWVELALCAQTDPEAFFPEKGRKGQTHPSRARAVCTRCPAEAECLEWALVHDERYGIWGNTTPKERAAIRVRLGLADSTDDIPEGDETA